MRHDEKSGVEKLTWAYKKRAKFGVLDPYGDKATWVRQNKG